MSLTAPICKADPFNNNFLEVSNSMSHLSRPRRTSKAVDSLVVLLVCQDWLELYRISNPERIRTFRSNLSNDFPLAVPRPPALTFKPNQCPSLQAKHR